MDNKYIYAWKEQGIAGSGLPFYIGQGTHRVNSKYPRAYAIHYSGTQNGRLSYAQRKVTLDRFNDPIKKAEWYNKFNTPEVIEKLKQIHSELNGIKIIHNGIEYRSKKELSRFLGISSQLLNYRIKNNIPLDLIPDKSNRRNKEF